MREHTRLPLIAKIEKPQAVDRMDEIIRAADCVMVARGDLGIELPIELVPIVQKNLLDEGRRARAARRSPRRRCSTRWSRRRGRRAPRSPTSPTRSSTAPTRSCSRRRRRSAMYPVESIAMMASIAETTEPHARLRATGTSSRVHRDARDPSYTMAYAACRAARELELDALVIPTLSGRSARLVSAHRPTVPIFALSPGRETVRRCGLMWGVRAASIRRHEVTEELINDCARRVVELGWLQPGQRVGHHGGAAERAARQHVAAADPAAVTSRHAARDGLGQDQAPARRGPRAARRPRAPRGVPRPLPRRLDDHERRAARPGAAGRLRAKGGGGDAEIEVELVEVTTSEIASRPAAAGAGAGGCASSTRSRTSPTARRR